MRNGESTLRHLLTPIQDLLDDPATTEVVCQHPGEIGYEQENRWSWREVPEFTYRRLDALGILAGSLLSKRFDPAAPICLTNLPAGQRFTICRPPVTPPGTISLTIRNPMRDVHTIHQRGFADLVRETEIRADRLGASDAELRRLHSAKDWTAFFSLAVRSRKTIAATGRVGSGKTTLLRSLMQEIPAEERLVTIEDTAEFGELPLRNRVEMYYGSSGITAETLVETSLRQRPDRICLQELRGGEAFAYLRLLAAGHPGLTTWHGEEGDPWTPVALMAKQHPAGREVPDDKLLAIVQGLIDIVAHCVRDEHGFRIASVYYRGAQS